MVPNMTFDRQQRNGAEQTLQMVMNSLNVNTGQSKKTIQSHKMYGGIARFGRIPRNTYYLTHKKQNLKVIHEKDSDVQMEVVLFAPKKTIK